MYICDECSCIFEKPKALVERHGFDQPPFEKRYVCPKCGSGNYTHTERCMVCNQLISNYYADTEIGKICDGCYTIKNIFEDQI